MLMRKNGKKTETVIKESLGWFILANACSGQEEWDTNAGRVYVESQQILSF